MCEQGKKADYIEESDLSLIRQCRGGSQRAAAALIARYAGLVHMSVSRIAVVGSDPEDLLQEAYMGLMSAIRSYDPQRGASFRTYAYTCVGNSLINMRDASLAMATLENIREPLLPAAPRRSAKSGNNSSPHRNSGFAKSKFISLVSVRLVRSLPQDLQCL